ncbi:MAG: transcription termination/antitermination protein NusA [Alphaproteobacteria bacterium]|jgi:N utilization substance protein A|nr:transcription termination/antitermination protein NusA [Alphaproteobacteria bacterium]
MSVVGANRLELLQIADAVAREKSIDKTIVLEAMAEAIQRAARSRYGMEYDIRAIIDERSGIISLKRFTEIVDVVENPAQQMALETARLDHPEIQTGEFITEELPPIDFGRIAAQTAKQVIVQRVRDAERERQYNEYKDRVGEIINGVVRRVEYGHVIVDLGRAEAICRREQLIRREAFRVGDRFRAVISKVTNEGRGHQIFLSRTASDFMAKLFGMEVPEIYEGVIEVKAVARDPGSRAKIAVLSRDNSIDPVGACVGMRGSRVQAVVNELQGEKIDIINWTDDPATFIINALAPANVAKVVMDEDAGRIEVVVADDNLSIAIGRGGQNVRLASQLTGWEIDILTEQEESERRQEEFRQRTELFINALDVDEMIAQLLASEGFTDIEEVAYVALEEVAGIDGFDEELADALQDRARAFLSAQDEEYRSQSRNLGAQEDLVSFDGLTGAMLIKLAEHDIKSLDDFAGLVAEELSTGEDGEPPILDGMLDLAEAEMLIIRARIAIGWMNEEDLEAFLQQQEGEQEVEEE